MSLCINPRCPYPDHPGNAENRFCQTCGSGLLLQGRYRVMRVLSDTSGFGTVYEAYEQTTPKILKVLKPKHNNNPKAVELFQKEAEVLGQLNHPGIPKVAPEGCFQFLPRDGSEPVYCFVMEKIDGPNLTQWMWQQDNQPISERQAVSWLRQLTEILSLVHQHNYFHRDIKPQNIMIRSTGELVLVDFGAAREMTYTYLARLGESDGSITQISSPGYTPPEQVRGQAIPQSDFYALGRTFVYLLTGIQLTDAKVYDALKDEFRWRNYAPTVSPGLADLIDRLIAPRAVNRPQNIQEILAAIARLSKNLSDVHSASRPGQPHRRLLNSTRFPRTVLQFPPMRSLLAGTLTLVVGVGVAGLWYAAWHTSTHPANQSIQVVKTLAGHTSYVNCLAISPDGQFLASGSADKTIKLWNLSTGQAIRTLKGHSSFVNTLVFSPNGEELISGGADRTINVWHLSTGQKTRTLTGHSSYVNALVVSPDGAKLISGSADRTIKVWSLTTGKEIRTLTGHTGYINAIAISPDGTTLVSASTDHAIKLWDFAKGQEIRTLTGHSDYVNAIAISPDGTTLVSASTDQTIILWDLATGYKTQTLTGHSSYINALAISNNGQTLLSGSSDQTIKLWDLTTAKEVRTLSGYRHAIRHFVVSPDWQAIITGSGDKIITIWRL
ncbi:MAG: protein kinase [Leptolyngbyaceae cyanobacterium RU_5_1]|nr:protein kinase [Leptolyngbyaceae cyanobacterium RU_5_1]